MKNLRIVIKLIGLAGILLLLLALVAGFGISKMSNIGEEIKEIAEELIPMTEHVIEVETHQLEQAVYFERALRYAVTQQAHKMREAEEQFVKHSHGVDKSIAKTKEIIESALAHMDNGEKKTELKNTLAGLMDIAEQHDEFDKHVEEIFALLNKGDLEHAEKLASKTEKEEEELNHAVETFLAKIAHRTAESALIAEHDEQAAEKAIMILSFFAFVLGLGLSLWISRGITQPIQTMVARLRTLAEGVVSERLDLAREDEIGDMAKAVDEFSEKLETLVLGLFKQIAAGNLAFDGQAQSSRDEIHPILKQLTEALQAVLDEIQKLNQAATEGRLKVRIDASRFEGGYREMIAGINQTLDATTEPVNEASEVLEQVSNRDLTVRVTGDYKGDHNKIKTALNATTDALQDAMSQVKSAAEQVSSAGSQIAASSQSVAQGASEQASSLEETSASLEEMSSMTRQNADNTRQAKSIALSTQEAAQRGSSAMVNMNQSMQQIQQAAEGTSQIISDINEIAFQTNLLALNAAVEAARAGDAGRGFAVVAEEVRNLALRSKEAASKTEQLIKKSVDLAQQGAELTTGVSSNLDEIVGSVGKVTDIVSEIAIASDEQARGIDQVNTAVTQMDAVVQQAASNSEESSSAAEELASQAAELNSLVSRFRVDGQAGYSSAVVRPEPKPRAKAFVSGPAPIRRPGNGSAKSSRVLAQPDSSISLDESEATFFEEF